MKYFSQTDFAKADPPCSIHDMDQGFLEQLDMARELAGIPFCVNSAYRSLDHEYKKGRDGSSSHVKGLAIDISAKGSRQRHLILEGLRKAGFKRIGIGKNFIHVDCDPDKDQNVTWHYYE